MKALITIYCSIILIFSHAHARETGQSTVIDFNTEFAQSLMEIACSNRTIDEDQFRFSKYFNAQIAHHSSFGERFSLDNFMAMLHLFAIRCWIK